MNKGQSLAVKSRRRAMRGQFGNSHSQVSMVTAGPLQGEALQEVLTQRRQQAHASRSFRSKRDRQEGRKGGNRNRWN